MMHKRWHLLESDAKFIEELSASLGISAVLARVLANRGMKTTAEARHFLEDKMADLADPFLMKGMDTAVQRICRAVADQERIVIYGDYDVDGITATSLLMLVLRSLGAEPDYYIPVRQSEGYGLNQTALEELANQGVDLLITVDCGISSYDDVAAYKDRLDIIVTDHHEPPQQVPPALAVLNPKQSDCAYPFKNLAGVGVAYTLSRALWLTMNHEVLRAYTEIAALGTVADLVSLTGENRVLVKAGLHSLKAGNNMGIQALCASSGLKLDALNAGRIAFTIAPRLNAAGRISHADKGVRLLLESDAKQARLLADELSEMNGQRQDIEHKITEQAIQQIEQEQRGSDGVLVAAGADWHVGVIGIAASRLVEQYYRPALVISLHDGQGKGSCRSISSFNIYESLQYCSDLLIQFGGHPMAAGFSIEEKNIEAFRQRLNEYAAAHMTAADYIPAVSVDLALKPEEVTLNLVNELSSLEPYGMGNSRPIFTLLDRTVEEIRPIGKDKSHLRFSLAGEQGRKINGVGWSQADLCNEFIEGDRADVAFQLERNDFNGFSSPQMVLQDIHGSEQADIELDRQAMVDIYLALRNHLSGKTMPVWQLRQQMLDSCRDNKDGHRVCAALSVLQEIGVLQVADTEAGPAYHMPQLTGKMSLSASPTFRKYGGDRGNDNGI